MCYIASLQFKIASSRLKFKRMYSEIFLFSSKLTIVETLNWLLVLHDGSLVCQPIITKAK